MNSYASRSKLFEHKIIDLLLRSKDYIGRGCIITNDPDKIVKNNNICKIIDRIRYGCNPEQIIVLLREKFKNRKLLIDGGNASSTYYYFKKADLGNASLSLDDVCGENTSNICDDKYYLTLNYKNETTTTSELIILKGGNAETVSFLGCTGHTGNYQYNYQDIALKGGNANTISVLGMENPENNCKPVVLNGGNADTIAQIHDGHTGVIHDCC
jgi:hypothetical protein